MNKKRAIYPGSFDPITFGHINIIERAATQFDEVIIAIGINPSKKYTLPLNKRLNIIKYIFRHNPKINVVSFSGLLADYAYEQQIGTIIKGIRDATDFNYEQLLHEITITQQHGLETVEFIADQQLRHVSSTAAKELVKFHGLVNNYVPLIVKQELDKTINKQTIIGVTGTIGVGKSFVTDKLVEVLSKQNITAHNIDLDKIAHEILSTASEPVYVSIRNDIIKKFNLLPMADGSIDRKQLGRIVFNHSNELEKLNLMLRQPLLTKIRKSMADKEGYLFLNGALLIEGGWTHLCNNNVILVRLSSKDTHFKHLLNRGLSVEQIESRLQSQYSTHKKESILESQIEKDDWGSILNFFNYEDSIDILAQTLTSTAF